MSLGARRYGVKDVDTFFFKLMNEKLPLYTYKCTMRKNVDRTLLLWILLWKTKNKLIPIQCISYLIV